LHDIRVQTVNSDSFGGQINVGTKKGAGNIKVGTWNSMGFESQDHIGNGRKQNIDIGMINSNGDGNTIDIFMI